MTLPDIFETYLLTKGSSRVTIKNYSSDLNHFLGWLELTLRSENRPFLLDEPEYLSRYFNFHYVDKYRNFLVANELPAKTINRRLSTLRNLASLAISQGWVRENPLNQIQNITTRAATLPLHNIGGGQITNSDEKNQEGQIPNTKYQIPDSNNQILSDFKTSLEKENTSANTIKNYLSDIRKFLSWLETEVPV